MSDLHFEMHADGGAALMRELDPNRRRRSRAWRHYDGPETTATWLGLVEQRLPAG